jgi:peptidoglycan/LPS O-acetylase OafA/YrhL
MKTFESVDMKNKPVQYLRGLASILVIFAHFKVFPLFEFFNGARE